MEFTNKTTMWNTDFAKEYLPQYRIYDNSLSHDSASNQSYDFNWPNSHCKFTNLGRRYFDTWEERRCVSDAGISFQSRFLHRYSMYSMDETDIQNTTVASSATEHSNTSSAMPSNISQEDSNIKGLSDTQRSFLSKTIVSDQYGQKSKSTLKSKKTLSENHLNTYSHYAKLKVPDTDIDDTTNSNLEYSTPRSFNNILKEPTQLILNEPRNKFRTPSPSITSTEYKIVKNDLLRNRTIQLGKERCYRLNLFCKDVMNQPTQRRVPQQSRIIEYDFQNVLSNLFLNQNELQASKQEKRPPHQWYKHSKYKTKMCPKLRLGLCPKGTHCKFAHNLFELRGTSEFYKTQICSFWLNGDCKAGLFCRHAHGQRDLNVNMDW